MSPPNTTMKDGIEMRSAPADEGGHLTPTVGGSVPDDNETLMRLGKRPLLSRSFGFMSSLGLSCSVLISWEGILITSTSTLVNVGPGGVIWAFLIGWLGTASIYAVVAELASIAPTAGGQYHWVAMMAPESCANFLAYLTAWLTTLAWQAISITTSYSISTLIQGLVVLSRPAYAPEAWHTVLMMLGVAVFSVAANSTSGRVLAALERLFLILHLVGFFGILVPLVYFAPHNSPAEVFTTFYNHGMWPTQGLAFLVGLPTVAATLTGADCAVHLSEEVRAANVVVPQSLIYTIAINGALAFAMVIAVLFCRFDVDAVLEAADTVFYPFLKIFQVSVKSTTGACLMAGIILSISVGSSISAFASASRLIWSFARDRGLPFDGHLVRPNKKSLPVYAIVSTMVFTTLLSLIVLGSEVVLSALLSLLLAALYSSYLISAALLLWHRVRGTITAHGSESNMDGPAPLTWGPWKVPEPFGTINNAIACCYTAFVLFWSFWPQSNSPDPASFNWSVVVFGGVIVFSILWYLVRARSSFKGPIKEI
ncbi:amino acid transporter [Xylariomycetidae sp. FL0641]|nr:amino acid transporter [Xylariomycetidae sp. FL0641]